MSDYIDSYYTRTAHREPVRPELRDRIDTRVCIVGAGLAGLSTALALGERGWDVVVLEANRVGWGASGRNGGFVGPGFSLPPRRLAARLGLARARELYALSRVGAETVRKRIERYRIDCLHNVDGSLRPSWFDDRQALHREQAFMQENFSEESEFWPTERVRGVLRSERYHDALFFANTFQFHPLDYCLGMARAAQSLGVKIFESSAAVEIGENPVGTVRTRGGEVRAEHVVLTCGGYIGKLQRRLRSAIVPVATYVIATRPLGEERLASAIDAPYAVADNRFASDYYRRLPDTRILWGGRITVRQSDPPDLSGLMLGDLLKVYPQLQGVAVESAWSGLMSYAAHKMPQIGALRPGLWYAMGFGGHGMNTTAMAGDLIAAAIAEHDDRYRLFAPFGLTPTGGAAGAAAAELTYWYYQLRDRMHSPAPRKARGDRCM